MIKSLKTEIKNNSGFTLIEMVLVIAILAILSAIAIPKVGKTKEAAEIVAHNTNVRTLESVANTYVLDKGLPSNEKTIILDNNKNNELKEYIQEVPKVPDFIKKNNSNSEYYKVTIDKDGKIEVSPGKQ
ncbi:MAG: type II secretion system GspH family protein [Clostridiaceae bacterium]|nr:type II secretion system GspH family protein [Clostridiaceae bacterium]MBW4859850.1 type II secretion system GspH family protein [Clostridiaceae bacterium]MBW4869720.1 type II secretion system GspH family protein [Clostridiaceae bacterium]